MKVATKLIALGAVAFGMSIAGHAAAEDPVDIDTAKRLIGDKLKDATRKAEANCQGLKEKNGKPATTGPVRMTLLVSHEGHTAPVDIYVGGGGATARCVAGYFTFTHPPYKGPDVRLDYGVQITTPKG